MTTAPTQTRLLDGHDVLGWVTDLADRTPDAFADAAADVRELVGDSHVIDKLVDAVATYSRKLTGNLSMSA